MCSSRKYSYPPPPLSTEGTFVLDPHPAGISIPGGAYSTDW